VIDASGAYNYWHMCKAAEVDETPIAALVALAAHLKENVPIPQDLAEWFSNGFDTYWKGSGDIPLEQALGIKKTGKGNKSPLSAYKSDKFNLLVDIHLMVSIFGLSKEIAIISAMNHRGVVRAAGTIQDEYNTALCEGLFEKTPMTGKLSAYAQTKRMTGNADLSSVQKAKVERALNKYLKKHGNLTQKEADKLAKKLGML